MSFSNSNESIQDGELLPFQMDHLPEFFWKKSEMELNETPENRIEKMKELKRMIAENEVTNGFNFEEDLLVQYLRHGKYDIKRAFKQVLNYVALRSKHNHLFRSIPDEHFEKYKNSVQFILPLPKRMPDGCTLFLTRMGEWNPDEMSWDDYVRLYILFLCQLMRDPMTQINGFHTIHDFKNTTWSHFKYCTPWNMHFLCHASLDCIPARFKGIHFINESFVLRGLWIVIKRFLSPKIRNRVFFHHNVEGLLDYFPRSVLPVEYGGDFEVDILKDWVRKANKDQQTNTINGQPNFY